MSNSIIEKFFDDLNRFLLSFAENNSLEKVSTNFRPIISRENGSKTKGDFSLSFVSPKFQLWLKYLPQICEQLLIDSREWNTFQIINFKICDRIKRIQLFICRQTCVEKLIQNFCAVNEVLKNNKSEDNLLIICVTYDLKNEFTLERLRRVANSLSKLMNTSCVDLNYSRISDESFEQLLTFATNSVNCEILDKNRLLFRDKPVCTDSTVKSKHVLIDKTQRIVFELMCNSYELIGKHVKIDTKSTVVLVISESIYHRIKQSFHLMYFLYNLKLEFKFILVSNVITNHEFNDYIQSLNQKLLDQNNDSLDRNSENFHKIIETSITLSLLSTTPSSVVTKLDSYLNESIFIQYNCARLKAIINRYNSEYAVISSDNPINLSVLSHDLEWSLVFNQFSNYESLIELLNNFIESDKSVFNINQLILFLKRLVSDVSVYYKKVKVLTEPSPHLLSLINARIYLCEILLELLINCLNILGLKAVDYL